LLTLEGYFFGLHLLGVLFLLPWIWNADPKYREYLASQGQGETWWYVALICGEVPALISSIQGFLLLADYDF
jgi:hypothetical protein